MQLAMITAQQVAVLFLLIFTGAAATKVGILRSEGKQTLSGLLVNVVVPAMILNSYQMEFSMEILRNLLAAFGLSVLAILLGTGVTVLLTARRKDSRASIFRFACIFSNAAYMGFPLISALFGARVCCMPAPTLPYSTCCCGPWAMDWSAARPVPGSWAAVCCTHRCCTPWSSA